MRLALTAAACLAAAAPAVGQDIRAQEVAYGFVEGVVLCAEARLNDGLIGDLDPALLERLRPASDAARDFLGAPPEQPTYEVIAGRGVVVIEETAEGRCLVNAYGPLVAPTFALAYEALAESDLAFQQVRNTLTPAAYIRVFDRAAADGDVVRVTLDGGEPGMAGRPFRLPLLLGYVTRRESGE